MARAELAHAFAQSVRDEMMCDEDMNESAVDWSLTVQELRQLDHLASSNPSQSASTTTLVNGVSNTTLVSGPSTRVTAGATSTAVASGASSTTVASGASRTALVSGPSSIRVTSGASSTRVTSGPSSTTVPSGASNPICTHDTVFTEIGATLTIRKEPKRRPRVCHLCGKCYTTNNALHHHLKHAPGHRSLRHLQPRAKMGRPYPEHDCPHCDLTFKIVKFFEDHMRERHAQPRHFVCHICGKCFPTSTLLRTHSKLALHFDWLEELKKIVPELKNVVPRDVQKERDRTCTQCNGRVFKTGSQYYGHLRMVHKIDTTEASNSDGMPLLHKVPDLDADTVESRGAKQRNVVDQIIDSITLTAQQSEAHKHADANSKSKSAKVSDPPTHRELGQEASNSEDMPLLHKVPSLDKVKRPRLPRPVQGLLDVEHSIEFLREHAVYKSQLSAIKLLRDIRRETSAGSESATVSDPMTHGQRRQEEVDAAPNLVAEAIPVNSIGDQPPVKLEPSSKIEFESESVARAECRKQSISVILANCGDETFQNSQDHSMSGACSSASSSNGILPVKISKIYDPVKPELEIELESSSGGTHSTVNRVEPQDSECLQMEVIADYNV